MDPRIGRSASWFDAIFILQSSFCPGVTVQLRVACIKNIQGEETPCALFLEGRQVTVLEVLDRWLAFDHRYFKIQGDDDGVYILRHNLATDLWEVTFFEQRRNLAGIWPGRNARDL